MGISSLSAIAQSVSFSCDRMHAERQDGRLIGGGLGIHWEALDEDISVPRLLGLPCE